MTDDEYKDYEVELGCIVTAPSTEEARAALERSGIFAGALIGETMIEFVEVHAA